MINEHSTILGPEDATAKGICSVAYASGTPSYDSDTLYAIASAIIEHARKSGMRTSVLAGQILHETGAFTFTGDVDPEQFNFAGLGTTGGGVKGLYFPDADTGVRAVVSHEMAYIYGAVSKWPEEVQGYIEDNPRTKYVINGKNAGKVTYIDDYGSGRWAAAATNVYAPAIVRWANKVVEMSGKGEVTEVITPTIVDISEELYRNSAGGPNDTNENKLGAIWHYNGPPPNTDAYTQYKNDAVYHAQKDCGSGSYGDGIMYHYGIQSGSDGSYPDGTIFKLRDENAVLWHCGAWVPGGNGTGIAININVGEGVEVSSAALKAAAWLADDIRARRGIDATMFKGHQEVSPTGCPGTLMDTLVTPYREGSMATTVTPVPKDDGFLHENGFIIGGGFRSIVEKLEKVNYTFRMQFLGYAISNEGDGYLMSPETNGDGSLTGRYHAKKVVLQKFERNTLIHEGDEPNPEWQDVVPLSNRGFFAGFATDDNIIAILGDTDTLVRSLSDMPA